MIHSYIANRYIFSYHMPIIFMVGTAIHIVYHYILKYQIRAGNNQDRGALDSMSVN